MAYWGDTARAGRTRALLPRVAPPSPRDASVPPSRANLGSRAAPGAPRMLQNGRSPRQTVNPRAGAHTSREPGAHARGSLDAVPAHAGAAYDTAAVAEGQASQ